MQDVAEAQQRSAKSGLLLFGAVDKPEETK
jgi:hypothetical protein